MNWSELRIIAAAEGLIEGAVLVVSAPIARAEDGRRFVLGEVDRVEPAADLTLREDEYREHVHGGDFVEVPGWSARPYHVILLVRAALWYALSEWGVRPEATEVSVLQDGTRAFYLPQAEAEEFQRRGARRLSAHVLERLGSGREQLARGELNEIGRTLEWAAMLAPPRSEVESEVAAARMLLCERFDPAKLAAARKVARVVTGLDDVSLDAFVASVRARTRRSFPPSPPTVSPRESVRRRFREAA